MKHLLLTMLCALLVVAGNCQEPNNYKIASAKFIAFYNEMQYDSIWQHFSAQMQEALPREKNESFFSNIYASHGRIENSTYDKREGTIVHYKTKFEHTMFSVTMVLDEDNKISGLRMLPELPDNLPVLERNKTKLRLPFIGEWTVFWGGDTKDLNYHVENRAQKNAFDMMITDSKGSTHKNKGAVNEDYYAFGQPIIAPCDGEVVMAVDGIKDNKPGEMNPIFATGNSIMLKTANNEYLLFAHFKQGSLKVKEGDKITQGQQLGLCGNSGNSSEPHLHFHIENVENMNVATGAKCYFGKILVNGQLKTDYSPIKGDKIKNAE